MKLPISNNYRHLLRYVAQAQARVDHYAKFANAEIPYGWIRFTFGAQAGCTPISR